MHRRRFAGGRRHTVLLHKTIDTVRTEMEALRFNTAIAKLVELNNHVTASMPRPERSPNRWC